MQVNTYLFFFPSSLVYSFTIGNCVFFSTIHRCCSQWTSGTLAFILCSPTLISGLKRRCLCSKRRWYNRAWDPNPVCLEPMSGLVEAYGEGSKSGEPAWSPCCRGKNHSCLLIVLICSFTPRWCFVDWEIHSNPSFRLSAESSKSAAGSGLDVVQMHQHWSTTNRQVPINVCIFGWAHTVKYLIYIFLDHWTIGTWKSCFGYASGIMGILESGAVAFKGW